ncbi:conserved hypothetical protein [Leishmania major strain Friedlin]|uniref:Uncharacterized protein n=1 Tax=Leishmania major TaxID=5664 RepID=Q4Q9U0_LEIMA|nr:conserved hypothetical protein [Leishmania major strain Friedlin]CAG9575170.1 hypothetical_protein_-_conserved [Leishmania major strain Friedlin]CAJ05309.1 conserved hypothetical protein [Leishmania major strain Friedlin]|eukprot:XP_001683908.1 conserved hypothetical protein [Leishmania major strain Friedlin]
MEIVSLSLKSFIEPLIDLIHGDLVLEDICCQRVAHAFVEHHEAALRRVVTSHTLPSGLEKAIESYCVRSYVLNAPKLLTESHEVAQMLQRLADTLIEAARAPKGEQQNGRHDINNVCIEDAGARSPLAGVAEVKAGSAAYLLATSAEMIKEDVAALQARPETQRCARLIDSLGEVVLGHIMYAAQQCAQQAQEYLGGASWHCTRVAHASYHAALHQFVKSAVEHREARKRERDAAQEAEVQALLFGSDHAIVEPAARNEGRYEVVEGDLVAVREPAQHDAPPAPPESPDTDFATHVQAAMESMPSSPQPPPQPLLKHSIPQTTSTSGGRVLHSVNDSIAEQCEALVHMTPPATLQVQQQQQQSTPVQSSAPHSSVLAAAEGRTSAPVEPALSPEIVVDPFSLAAASSSLVTSSERDAPQENDDTARPPHRKLRKADTIFIGASETSVLRMMEHTNADGSESCHLLSSPTSASASIPSSTLPIGAQRRHDSSGTTGGTVPSATSTNVAAADVTDAWEGVRRCLQRQDAEPRSYFLCGATHRFEPCVARGFF